MRLRRRVSQLPLLLLGLSHLLVCIWSQEPKPVFAIAGEDFTFSLGFKEAIGEIVWKKGKDKVAEWERERSIQYYNPLLKRGELNTSSGDLTIRNVSTGDSAEYDAQVLPAGGDQFRSSKFVFEVLDPPPSPVLNCTVNGQINISCKSDFSKDLTYSWNYASMGKDIEATGSVIQIGKNVDQSEGVVCTIKVSKTKVSSSISLEVCFRKTPDSETPTRSRGVVIAIIIFLVFIAFALFVLWKKGLLNNILRWLPTKQSAVYKIEERPGENQIFLEQGVRKEGQEHANPRGSEDPAEISDQETGLEETKPLSLGNSQSVNLSQDDKVNQLEDENKESAPVNHLENENAESKPDFENMPNKSKESGEEDSEATKSVYQSVCAATEENTGVSKSKGDLYLEVIPQRPASE